MSSVFSLQYMHHFKGKPDFLQIEIQHKHTKNSRKVRLLGRASVSMTQIVQMHFEDVLLLRQKLPKASATAIINSGGNAATNTSGTTAAPPISSSSFISASIYNSSQATWASGISSQVGPNNNSSAASIPSDIFAQPVARLHLRIKSVPVDGNWWEKPLKTNKTKQLANSLEEKTGSKPAANFAQARVEEEEISSSDSEDSDSSQEDQVEIHGFNKKKKSPDASSEKK